MKFLIVASCILAVVSAGFVGHSSYGYAPAAYHAGHVPVLDHNGYQLDTAEVAHAKAAHFAAHADANARTGHGLYADHSVVAPLAYAGPYAGHYAGHYSAQHIPVIGHNGVPLETPEVVAAKAHHAAAHIEAKARNGDLAIVAPLAHGYVASHEGPLDTPEVAHAKAAHFAAYNEIAARNAHADHYRYRRGLIAHSAYATPVVYSHAYPQHIPVIGHNGVPLETPEVVAAKIQHANAVVETKARDHHVHGIAVADITAQQSAIKAHHAAAHVEALARNGDLHYAHGIAAHGVSSYGIAAHGLVAPYAVAHGYAGPQHLPIIGHNGVPLDTPEVAAGKHANAVAHAEAHARNGDHHIAAYSHGIVAPVSHYAVAHHVPLIGHNGVPLDTPEVAVAKAHHAAAHLEAKARHGLVHHY